MRARTRPDVPRSLATSPRQREQRHRIHRDPSVPRDPVQVRPRRPPAPAHRTDHRARRDRVARRHVHPAQVEVAGHQPAAVVEVHRVARQVEVRHQRHHRAPRGAHRRAHRAGEIRSEMPAGHPPVELPPRAVHAGDPARPRAQERPLPEPRRVVRLSGDRPALRQLAVDPRPGRAVRLGIARRDGEPLAGVDRVRDRERRDDGVRRWRRARGGARPASESPPSSGTPSRVRNRPLGRRSKWSGSPAAVPSSVRECRASPPASRRARPRCRARAAKERSRGEQRGSESRAARHACARSADRPAARHEREQHGRRPRVIGPVAG